MEKTKKPSKVHDCAAAYLRRRGFDVSGLRTVRLGRGSTYLLVIGGDVIGEYIQITQKFIIYADVLAAYTTPEA